MALHLVSLVLRVVIGAYFIFAAVPKIVDPLAFATAIGHYQLLPHAMIHGFALTLPWLELLVGAALVVGARTRISALICGILVLMFTIAIVWALLQGLQIDCGCFGAQGGDEVSWMKVAKNVGMIAACGLLTWKPQSLLSVDGWQDGRRGQ